MPSMLYHRFFPRMEQDPETKEHYFVSNAGAGCGRTYADYCDKCGEPFYPDGEELCRECREEEDE